MSKTPRSLSYSAVVALATVLLSAGCLDVDRAGFTVINRLDQPIDVIYVRGPGTQVTVLHDLTPGLDSDVNSFVTAGACDDASMIATDASGAVVARFEGPVCDGTEWIVERAAPSRSP